MASFDLFVQVTAVLSLSPPGSTAVLQTALVYSKLIFNFPQNYDQGSVDSRWDRHQTLVPSIEPIPRM